MSKIYQKMYLQHKNRSEGVLGGFMNNTIMKSCYSEYHPFAFKHSGFTLIELLVVVLIIGILSAVAFPQYQKAVFKTRMTAVLPLLKAAKEAEEIYFLANGNYTGNWEDLNLGVNNIQWDGGHQWLGSSIDLSWAHIKIIRGTYGDNVSGCGWAYYLDHHPTRGGELICTERNGNSPHPWCKKLCESMGYEYAKWAA